MPVPSSRHYYQPGFRTRSARTHLSIIFMTFVLIFLPMPFCCDSSSRHCSRAWPRLTPLKSYGDPAFPKKLHRQRRLTQMIRTHCFSSRIQVNCFSRFSFITSSEDRSFAISDVSCSAFFRPSSESTISFFLIFRSLSRSLSSLSNATRVALSLLSLSSAAL